MRPILALIAALVLPGLASATFNGQAVRFDNFGGLNDTIVSTNVEDNESPDLLNVRFPLGAIQRRAGYAKLDNDQVNSTNALNGLYQVRFSSGTSHLIATAGGNTYRLNAGAWTSITGALTIASGQDVDVDFDTITDLMIMSDNSSRLLKWSGSGNVAALGGSPPTACRAIASFRNYLILGNTIESAVRYQARIRWSALNNAESWPAANFNTLLNNVGDEILDLVPLGDSLYVFMRRSIWRMDYTGNAAVPFRFTNVSPNRGAVSPRGQARVRNAIYFASDNGMYGFDGGEPAYLSKRTEEGWDDRNKARDRYIVALHNQRFNEVWFVHSTASATTNATAYVYDYERKTWSLFNGLTINVGTYYEDSSFNQLLVTGSYGGYVHEQNSGTSDDGSSITAYYKTKWHHFGDSLRFKQIKSIQIEANTESVDTSLTVAYRYDFMSAGTSLTYPLQRTSATFGDNDGVAEGTEGIFGRSRFSSAGQLLISKPALNRGRFVQFEISSNGTANPFTLFGLTVGVVGESQ